MSEHYNAIKNQGKRTDILTSISVLLGEDETCVTMRHKLKVRDVVSKTYGIGGTVVAQYLRVAQLDESLQERLDNREFALRAAVELSYLSSETQRALNIVLVDEKYKIEVRTAVNLRETETQSHGKLDASKTKRVINKNKSKVSNRSVKVNKDLLSQYFSDTKTETEISETIAKALEAWFANGIE